MLSIRRVWLERRRVGIHQDHSGLLKGRVLVVEMWMLISASVALCDDVE